MSGEGGYLSCIPCCQCYVVELIFPGAFFFLSVDYQCNRRSRQATCTVNERNPCAKNPPPVEISCG